MKITKENIGAQYTQFCFGKTATRVPEEKTTVVWKNICAEHKDWQQ